ncbi:MAG TPA: aspartate carbamoyltransferase [Gammaproteobacteria bacterium]|nr:aspartate carbamoyltransferase [Gammaproteobacteria bacterium]
MKNSFYMQDILSMKDLSSEQISLVLQSAAELKKKPQHDVLKNKIIASCFFEPSTRTRLSFESAAMKMGAKVIGFSSDESLSTKKGETLYDTMRVISGYADLLVIRHPKEGAARLAAEASTVPVVNAGDGANQHPTQTLVDLFSIQESQGRLDDLSIALVGDLKYGRTIHSFAQVCKLFNMRLFLVAPEHLTLPDAICDTLKREGVRFSFHQTLQEVIHKVDVVYMTRIQKERMLACEFQASADKMMLNLDMLAQAKPNLKILHPLPRVDEIDVAVDNTPYAYYFQQAENGIFVRQALLSLILSGR